MFHWLLCFISFFFRAIDFFLATLIAFLGALLPGFISRRIGPRLFHAWCWSFIRFIGGQVHLHERYKPPLPRHFLLISNHPSGFEILLLNALFPVVPLGKEEIRHWFLLGRIAQSAGSLFVKRDDQASRHAAKDACLEEIKNGKNPLIYPEGGCFGRHLRPFKYGPFEMAIAADIPILPVYVQYEAENAFEWGDFGLLRHVYEMTKAPNKHMHCYIFDPIWPEKSTTPKEFMEAVHARYEEWEKKYRLG